MNALSTKKVSEYVESQNNFRQNTLIAKINGLRHLTENDFNFMLLNLITHSSDLRYSIKTKYKFVIALIRIEYICGGKRFVTKLGAVVVKNYLNST